MPPTPQAQAKAPIRRRVRRQHQTGDEVTFVTKSFTKDDGTQYHPVINETTGEFSCNCPDHLYRHSFCKHLRRAQAQLKRPLPTPVASSPSLDTSIPVASPPTQSRPKTTHLSTEPTMNRFFSNERIVQIIPAPPSLKAQFADGCPDEPVLCLALLTANGERDNPDTQFQLVMPMVAHEGALELACDIQRPYLRLSTSYAAR